MNSARFSRMKSQNTISFGNALKKNVNKNI